MTAAAASLLMGAVAMASFVAMLFFLRHWQQTRETFFLLFAIAFGVDAASRAVLGLWDLAEDTEPLVYLARLVTFSLIILAIVQKNRANR
ncbi:DUF5985 family protein [Reyranella sp.]|uniref:DUF5985 family protein n=1 Tax=Reyranella sp. TaxID=1929291 RepID=UPI003D0BEA99